MGNNIKPDSEAALLFLEQAYPIGPWVLTAIRLDRKSIDTRTFEPSSRQEALAWLNQYNGQRNLYWSVNPTIKFVNKKAEREDIREVAYLHIDLDPRAGENFGEEKERLFNLAL
ncbi:MAG: hypothetical protein V3S14_03830, partial [Anaerolineae bacterium]